MAKEKIPDKKQIVRIFEFPNSRDDTEISIWYSGKQWFGKLEVYNRNWDMTRTATYDEHQNYHGELKQWYDKNTLMNHLWYNRNVAVADFLDSPELKKEYGVK